MHDERNIASDRTLARKSVCTHKCMHAFKLKNVKRERRQRKERQADRQAGRQGENDRRVAARKRERVCVCVRTHEHALLDGVELTNAAAQQMAYSLPRMAEMSVFCIDRMDCLQQSYI